MASERGGRQAQRIRGGVWAAVSALGSAGLAGVNFLVLSRILGPESYGLMAMVEATLALGQTMLSTGLAEPLIQLRRLRADHPDTLFWTLQGLSGALVLCAILLRGQVERYFQQPGLGGLLAATSFILYLRAVGAVPRALLARDMRFASTAQAEIIAEAAGGVVGVITALAGYGVWALVSLQVTSRTVEAIILWRKSDWNPSIRWSVEGFREIWRFSASRGLVNVLHFLDGHLPRILLGRVAGAAELGRFVFARRLLELAANILLSPLRNVAMPAFAQVQGSLDETRELYRQGLRLTTAATLPVFGGIIGASPLLVPLVLGQQWAAAVILVQLFAVNSFRQAFNMWNSSLLRGLGRPEWLLVATVVRTAGTLALIFLALPYGALGVCAAMVAGTFLSWPIAMRYAARLIDIPSGTQLRDGAPAFFSTAVMVGAVLLLWYPVEAHLAPWAGAVVLVLCGVAVYLLLLACIGRAELAGVVRFVRRLGILWRKGPDQPDALPDAPFQR